jgi:TPR repeat protein
MYYQGHGVQKDYSQALFWYRRAAEQGNVAAQNNLRNLQFDQPSETQATKIDQASVACDKLRGSGKDVPFDCLHPKGQGDVLFCEALSG